MKTKIYKFVLCFFVVTCLLTVFNFTLLPVGANTNNIKNIESSLNNLSSLSNLERVNFARDIIQQGTNTYIENKLIEFLKSSDRKKEEWAKGHASCNTAIKILGEFQSKKAVRYIIDRIEPFPGSPVSRLRERFSPVEKALIAIGLPSVEPLVERAKKGPTYINYWGPDRFYMMIDNILSEIMGRKAVVSLIKNAIENEKDKNKINELKKVLRVSEDKLLGGSGRFHPIRYGGIKNGYFEMHEKPVIRSPHPLKMNNTTNKDVLIYRIPEKEYRQRIKNRQPILPDHISRELIERQPSYD